MKLKSNRRFIMYTCLPSTFVIFFLLIIMTIGFFTEYEPTSSYIGSFITGIIVEVSLIFILLLAKYWKGKSYIFNANRIEVYNKGILKKTIRVSNVEYMHYYPWKFHYFITIYAGSLNEGGAMKIHIKEKDGTKHELGFIGLKDARELKKMYRDLMTIYYTKD